MSSPRLPCSWGLGAEFDRLSERLFNLAGKAGVRLSMRVRKHPTKLICVKPAKKKRARK